MNPTSKTSMKTVLAGLVMLAVFSAIPAFGIPCTTTITSTADSGTGSLRAAILAASSGDTICVTATGTITLTSGELLISQNITIGGPGASMLAIDGNNASRVFETASGTTVAISGLTVQNGNEASTQGGGIKNNGTLTLSNSAVSGNFGLGGGGIFNNTTGTMTIINSTISGNHSNLAGGGGSAGGGIWNFLTMTITDSTISGNTSGGSGGGILSESPGSTPVATLTIINSTISGNTALTFSAGGIENLVAALNVSNSTISGNSALGNGGTGGDGGGIANFGTATLKNSLLAGNTSLAAGEGNCYITVTSLGHNFSDDTSCTLNGFSQATDINNMPAGLDPSGLQLNSPGTTKTIALQPTSLAVNNIPLAACTDVAENAVTIDQRGVARPQPAGGNCDIGAYELIPAAPPVITFGTAPTPTYLGPNFTVSATTTNTDSATLTFSAMSGPCTFVSETSTTGTFSSTGAGTCVVKASGAATTNFLAGSNTQSVTIAAAMPLITFSAAPTPTYLGGNFTVSATTTNTDSTTVTYSYMSGPCALVSATAGTFSSSGAGTCVVKTSGAATTNFLAASNTQSVTIAAAMPLITFGPAPTPTFPGGNFTVSATTNSNGGITFSAMSGPCAFVSQTATTGTFSPSATGTCVVKASTAATTNFLANSNTQSVVISSGTNSPAQMVANLVTTVQGMNITGQGTSLIDQLNQVKTDITTNNGLACQDLLLFVNHVKAQTGKKITTAQANQLLAAAAKIQAALGC